VIVKKKKKKKEVIKKFNPLRKFSLTRITLQMLGKLHLNRSRIQIKILRLKLILLDGEFEKHFIKIY